MDRSSRKLYVAQALRCEPRTVRISRTTSRRLANLLLQLLTGVANAFLLVRIRFTQRTHLRRDLPDLLPVDTADRQLCLFGINRDFDPRGSAYSIGCE